MSGISEALGSASNNIGSLERSLSIIQSNVDNASVPGYARQDLVGAIGSSSDANVVDQQSSRNEYAETAVRQQNSLLGHFNQLTSILGSVEPNFSASGTTGIPNAINNLFAGFSALSTNPNDSSARQSVIDQATELAKSFNSTASNLASIQSNGRQQISSQVDTINHLASLVQAYNSSQQSNASGASDPIVDAKLHDTLEQLSGYASVQALKQNDGSITLLLGGQTPLVVGKTQYNISANITSGPTASILDSTGADVTSLVSGGTLSGALVAVNQSIPSYQNSLNQLAQGVADSVNTALAAGVDTSGNAGAPLFTYNSPADAAASLAVTGIAPAELAAASVGAPGGNGNALALSALGSAPSLNGFTFTTFYGNLSASVGRDVASATDSQTVQTQLLAQARAQRTSLSGVSLDEEAVRLVDFQRAYEATAKLVSVLDQLSLDTINMIPQA
jgi:flagellar hook-associated protein 1 FlgK